MIKTIIFPVLLIMSISIQAQTLGGGTNFSNAVTFNQSWLTGCPSGGSPFSNQAAFEPTTTLDPCAPVPTCATETTGSDVWFSFYAQSTTATIAVDPSVSFDIAIQSFSGTTCPGLTEIGCANTGGINGNETLLLTSLTIGVRYYFRIFGSSNNAAQRTGTYTFCGSAGLGSTPLPVEMSSFSSTEENGKVILKWTTVSEWDNAYFEIERSKFADQYTPIGRVPGGGTTTQTLHYSFTDLTPFSETNYYRIKQVDIDGRYKYSVILPLKMDSKLRKAINVSTNPVFDKINIRVTSDVAVNSNIRILNASGQVIHQQKENFVKGENIITINNLKTLSRGVYTLQAFLEGQMLSTKFISIR